MRLLLIVCCWVFFVPFGESQTLLSEKMDFRANEQPVAKALQQLSRNSEINIAFSTKIFDDSQIVSLDAKNESIKAILTQLLDDTGVGFKVASGQIILFAKPKRRFVISGFVEDSLSGERLMGANIFESLSANGAATNEYGFFSLELEEGTTQLQISYLGYQNYEQKISLDKNKEFVIPLKPSLTLQEIVVIASDSIPPAVRETTSGTDKINLEQVALLPSLGGGTDVMRLMDMLPGVQTGTDGVGGLHVRGGNADQNLVLLDGVPVYNAGHMAGIFSMFSDMAIQNASLQKDNFDTRYGGRTSSILDIRMREGNRREWHGGVAASIISAKANLEGPIIKDKASFFIAGRRFIWDVLFSPFSQQVFDFEGEFLDYEFYDWNFKLNYSLTEKDKFYFSHFQGGDAFKYQDTYNTSSSPGVSRKGGNYVDIDWKNTINALRWNHIYNQKLFSNTTLTHSSFDFSFLQADARWEDFSEELEQLQLDYNRSKIQDTGLRFDFDYFYSPQHLFKFGSSFTIRQFRAVTEATTEEDGRIPETYRFLSEKKQIEGIFPGEKTNAIENTFFFEDNYTPSKKWQLKAGLYTSFFFVKDKGYLSLEPRLFGKYSLSRNMALEASLSRMSQFLHLISGSNIGLPSDLWAPTTDNIRPQSAWQVSSGFTWDLPKEYHFKMSGYYKILKNMLSRLPPNIDNPIDVSSWQELVEPGKGSAYGFEWMLEKSIGKTTGWIDYTLSWAWRQFPNIDQGSRFPFKYDRRHYVKAALIHQFSKKFQMGFNWVYGTGNPTTLSEGTAFLPNGQSFTINTPRNSIRMPEYHRLDLSFNFVKHKKRGIRTWNISIYNAYNRQNPLFLSTREVNGQKMVYQTSLIPILPSFEYKYEF